MPNRLIVGTRIHNCVYGFIVSAASNSLLTCSWSDQLFRYKMYDVIILVIWTRFKPSLEFMILFHHYV